MDGQVHWQDLQPFQFSFTPIIMWDITKPNCLKTHGIVPLYENTRVPTDAEYEQFLAGNPPWSLGSQERGIQYSGLQPMGINGLSLQDMVLSLVTQPIPRLTPAVARNLVKITQFQGSSRNSHWV